MRSVIARTAPAPSWQKEFFFWNVVSFTINLTRPIDSNHGMELIVSNSNANVLTQYDGTHQRNHGSNTPTITANESNSAFTFTRSDSDRLWGLTYVKLVVNSADMIPQ